MNPTVSVIIPCYNQARFLSDCVASLQAQTYPYWEAIIVNDGSSDNTSSVAEAFAADDSRIRVIHQANQGLSGARNQGIEMACGEFIQFLDADDLILPGKLEAQISLFADHDDLAVVYSDFAFFNDGDTTKWVDSPALFKTKYGTPDMLRSLLSGNFIVVHSALTRRTEIEKLGGFDLSLGACEDYDLWLRLASRGKKFAYCNGIYALYRQHAANMTSNRPRQIQHTISVLERVPNVLSIDKVEIAIWSQHLATLHLDLISKIYADQPGNRPKVTVCIPTFNGARYIKECLDSVISQSMKDMEIIIVDDQSTDATWEMLQAYSALYPEAHIRLFRNENNLGLVGNWNRCMELARGEWIKFVFQDDWIEPECLEVMLDASTLSCSIVACQRNFAFEEGVSKSTQQYFLNIPTLSTLFPGAAMISAEAYSEAVIDNLAVNFVGEPTAVMFRRSVFEKSGFFNPRLIQICDFEFWTRIAVHTGIAFAPRPLATFRLHGNSTTAKNAKHGYGIELDVLSMLHDFVSLPVYAPLRSIAMNRNPPFDLTQELGKRTRGTRWLAIDVANRLGDRSLLHEWATFLQSYPALLPFVDEQPSFFKKYAATLLSWKKVWSR